MTPSALRRYSIPVLTVGAALAVTNVLVPLLHGITFVPLLVAIVLATWYGHAQGGILALVLSALGSAFFVLSPMSSFRISHPDDLLRLIVFLCAGGAMIWFIHVRQSLLNQVSILLGEAQARERAAEQHQEALIHAGKLATIGQLAAGVTHELNNPLSNAKLYLEMIQEDLREQASRPEVLQHANEAHGQVLRAAEIVSHLRFFARGGEIARQRCSLHDAITRALSFVQQPLRLASVTATFTACPADVMIQGNPTQLEQIFVNLLLNAKDAMRESATKRITITTQESHDGVAVYVDDSGSGIDPAVQDRLFTPFTTTKPPGAGLGLGLSICASIMKAHGGSIQVERSPAGGARFILRFPALADDTIMHPGTSAVGSELHSQ